jgi:hypothetical protein
MKPIVISTDAVLGWDTPCIKRLRIEMLGFIADMPDFISYSTTHILYLSKNIHYGTN